MLAGISEVARLISKMKNPRPLFTIIFKLKMIFSRYKMSSSWCGLKSIAIKITSMTRMPHCLMIFSDKRFCGNSYVIIIHTNHTNYKPKNKRTNINGFLQGD